MRLLITLIRMLRWRAWCTLARLRLRRVGVELHVQSEGTPAGATLPRLDIVARGDGGGSATLRLGADAKLGRELILEVWTDRVSVLELGARATFEAFCRVQLQGGTIVLADDVHVRDLCLLKAQGELRVGEGTILSRGVNLHATTAITIGPQCGIGERSSLIDSDHGLPGDGSRFLDLPLTVAPIVLGPGVAVGANCVLLKGTSVGAGAVLAAGAVLDGGTWEAGWLVGGVPARALRAVNPAHG